MAKIHEPLGDDTVLTHTLKAARDDKSKRLMDTTEVVPVTKHFKIDFFPQPAKGVSSPSYGFHPMVNSFKFI